MISKLSRRTSKTSQFLWRSSRPSWTRQRREFKSSKTSSMSISRESIANTIRMTQNLNEAKPRIIAGGDIMFQEMTVVSCICNWGLRSCSQWKIMQSLLLTEPKIYNSLLNRAVFHFVFGCVGFFFFICCSCFEPSAFCWFSSYFFCLI